MTGTDLIQIYSVDDNPFVADALRLLLKRTEGAIELAGAAESADALLQDARDAHWFEGSGPDIVLLDIDMPGKNAFDAVAELQELCGESSACPRVIMYTGLLDRALVDRALDAGAWGYVTKSDSPEDLMRVIREVAAGAFGFSTAVRALMR
jgi:two-component system, NarL family, invasion response regulator UvrY